MHIHMRAGIPVRTGFGNGFRRRYWTHISNHAARISTRHLGTCVGTTTNQRLHVCMPWLTGSQVFLKIAGFTPNEMSDNRERKSPQTLKPIHVRGKSLRAYNMKVPSLLHQFASPQKMPDARSQNIDLSMKRSMVGITSKHHDSRVSERKSERQEILRYPAIARLMSATMLESVFGGP